MAKRGRTSGLTRWAKSKAGRAHARQRAEMNRKALQAKPRCGAKRRDGEPCTQPAMSGRKRCRHHGGLTPAGKAWHVVQYPDASTPAGVLRFNRKVRQRLRQAEQRAARLAAMTPDQRAAYDAWHLARRPGLTKAARKAERDRRRQNAEARRLLAHGQQQAQSEDVARLQKMLAAAKAELARAEARAAIRPASEHKGVFE